MKLLILITKEATLHLLDGEVHASGFWAEEFVVPYLRFKKEGYAVDVASIGGIAPTPDKTSIDPGFMPYVRPTGSKADDAALAALYVKVIAETPELKHPLSIERITKAELAEYDAIYFSGGHGSIGDFQKSDAIAQLGRWAIELNTPIAAVCHGHCGLLALRDGEGRWPFEGYRMTCFSHAEELVTDMAGQLPFVLELEVRRLGALYEKAENIWDSHVVEDRNLLTGQNPYSSEALADAIVKRLATVGS